MNGSATYYTENLFGLSYWRLFKVTAMQSVAGALIVFPVVAFRKLIRWKFRPTSAQQRPAEFDLVSPAEFPADAGAAVAPLVGVAVSAGFEVVLCHRKSVIGRKREYTVLLVEPTGRMAVEITWIWQGVGQIENAQVTFTCESKLAGGRELNTLANPMIEALREFLPEWVEFQFLPDGTPPNVVLATHRQAISDRGDGAAVPRPQWIAGYLASAQRAFDHFIARGMLVPISPAEVKRLRAIDAEPIVRAELVR
ncbi:MAG: hypothetical protein L0211_03045 [Planctomycetaceae bacterium]|nr:hypothetical protein [Planctomycetaceae bacterium]